MMATTDTVLTEQQEEKIHRPDEAWSEDFARKIVLQDFQSAATRRQANHEWRWRDSDALYVDWAQQKYWEGTRIPRASIPVHVVFKQVESLMPRFMDIFADYPWADAEPYPGTTAEQARQNRDLVLFQFDEAKGRRHCRRAFKSGLIRGNGFIEAGWERLVQTKTKYLPQYNRSVAGYLPTPQGIVPIPGPMTRKVLKSEEKVEINRPYLSYVSIWDLYVDPLMESSFLQDGRFVIKRALLTLDYLDALRQQPKEEGFQIPARVELLELLKTRATAQGDESKRQSAALRGIDVNPGQDSSADPGSKKLEILQYVTEDRNVWLLGREHVIYNRPNQYGQINFFNAFYTDVLDACYGLSVADVVEGDHRLQRSLIEARIDELSLGIHRTRYKKRGSNIPAYQMRRRPGATIEMENPKEDIQVEDVANITQQAFMEVGASDMRAQQATGVTEQAVLGTAPAQGNAATRTATGSSIVAGAVGKRHGYMVETNESEFMEPILEFMAIMNTVFLDPDIKIQFLDGNGKQQTIEEPTEIMNSNIRRFRLHAGLKIRAKMGLIQSLPLILQTLLNPEVLGKLQLQGKTLDFQEIYNLVADATDYRPRQGLLRDLTAEEMQKLNQPPPEEMLRMQMQRERLTSAGENTETKGMFDLVKELVKQAMAEEKTGANGNKGAAA